MNHSIKLRRHKVFRFPSTPATISSQGVPLRKQYWLQIKRDCVRNTWRYCSRNGYVISTNSAGIHGSIGSERIFGERRVATPPSQSAHHPPYQLVQYGPHYKKVYIFRKIPAVATQTSPSLSHRDAHVLKNHSRFPISVLKTAPV